MSNFEWQTEDDFDWDAPSQNTPTQQFRQWLLLLPLLLLLVGFVIYSGYTRLNETVLSATLRTEEAIRTAYRTTFTAAATNDLELFNRMLSARDRGWTVEQQQMVGESGLLDRSAFGLVTEVTTPTVAAVSLSADFNAAIVTATVPYSVDEGETVQLSLVSVMRQTRDERWLYAPPLPEFWGETTHLPPRSNLYAPALSAEFPARDADLIAQLLTDLTDTYQALCRLNRPDAYRSSAENCLLNRYRIIFSTNPSTLTDTKISLDELPNPFVLPTPTLIGLPQDEAGYHALYVGYAEKLFPSIIADITGYECCRRSQYFDAIVAWQLDALGVRPYRLDYEQQNLAFANLRDLSYVADGWKTLEPTAAYGLIDYLLTSYPALTATDLVNSLNNYHTFPVWLRLTLEAVEADIPVDQDALLAQQSAKLQNYLLSQMDAPPTLPALPKIDLLLMCQDGEQSVLTKHDLQAGTFSEQRRIDEANLEVAALQQLDTVWIQMERSADVDHHTYLYRNDELMRLPINKPLLLIPFEQPAMPNIAHVLMSGQSNTATHLTLDLNTCHAHDCPVEQQSGGFDLYSRDGRYFIDLNEETLVTTLHHADGSLIRPLDEGAILSHYIWFTNEYFAQMERLALTLFSVDTEEPIRAITEAEFAAILPDTLKSGRIQLTPSSIIPQYENSFYLLITSTNNRREFAIVAVDLADFSLTLQEHFAGQSGYPANNAPDRFLTLQLWSGASDFSYLIYDLEKKVAREYPLSAPTDVSWSPDGDWFLMMGDGFGRLINATTSYTHTIIPPMHCNSAAWFDD